MSAIKLKNRMARTRKEFKRQESHRYKDLGTKWRRPRGKHSKMREGYNNEKMVNPGYRGPAAARGLHSSGKKEILVHTMSELDGLKDVVVRIGGTVGQRKKILITQKAESLHLRVLNPTALKSKVVATEQVKKKESNTAKKTGK